MREYFNIKVIYVQDIKMNTFEIEYFLQLSKTFMKNQQKMLEPLLQLLKVSVSIELNNTLDCDESIAPCLSPRRTSVRGHWL